MFGYTAYQFSCVAPVALMFFVGAAVMWFSASGKGVCNMTREESLEALCVAFEKLDEDEQRGMIRLIEQMKRAHTFGLDVRFDEHTFTFFIADAVTNTVVAPPPMNIPTVEAWLDDYEKEEAKE